MTVPFRPTELKVLECVFIWEIQELKRQPVYESENETQDKRPESGAAELNQGVTEDN